jgi:hypothetical protein
VPDGWWMDEWRGGSCAAVATTLTIDGETWEVVVLPDGDSTIPLADRDYSRTWVVMANRYDEPANGEWIIGELGPTGTFEESYYASLTLPAYREGDEFPTGQVLGWVATEVRAGRIILV